MGVMRLGAGAVLAVFNGRDGEWRAILQPQGRRDAVLEIAEQTVPMRVPPDLWLIFAPIRKARTDFVAEKATELGVRRIQPVITRHTRSDRLNTDRLRAHAIEAAEQCGAVFLPEVVDPAPLDRVLADWPPDRALIFCDEARDAPLLSRVAPPAPAAILIGPEGGFAPEEAAVLKARSQAVAVSLGPRILRTDTAAIAAIALWQAERGDW